MSGERKTQRRLAAAGEGKRDSWAALTSARQSACDGVWAAARHVGKVRAAVRMAMPEDSAFVGRPAIDQVVVTAPSCARSTGARARWPAASRCGASQ
jgi:hypothetical protein